MSCNCNCDCTHDSDVLYSDLLSIIDSSDTLSQFMQKCNNNFALIAEMGGGPNGPKGMSGDPGAPTKPKVPIHVWEKGVEYDYEENLTIKNWNEDLSDIKYQEGHLIILENAHVYILEADINDNYSLKPKYLLAMQSYNPGSVVAGKDAYLHIAYANAPYSNEGFITDQQWREQNKNGKEELTQPYMGIYTSDKDIPPVTPNSYTWVKIQGNQGIQGIQGETGSQGPVGPQGDPGDNYTGQSYTVDIEGDMSVVYINEDRKLISDIDNDYCECRLHAYYGNESVKLFTHGISIDIPNGYDDTIGKIEKIQNKDDNDVIIRFTPSKDFVFPKNTLIFPIHITANIEDETNNYTYTFNRDIIWMIKGIVSNFKLDIVPQYRTIKLFEDGKYLPEKLEVSVYKIEDGERTIIDLNENTNFTLLYKNYDDDETKWEKYPSGGVSVNNVSCIEFKIVRYYNTENEELWDYEDVWVVSDGKSAHYYHADLGNTESMMVFTTGEVHEIDSKKCAVLRNESGYSITFDPKFYDGSTELTNVNIEVNIGTNSGDEYYNNGTFQRKMEGNTFTVNRVPFGVDIIPMNFEVIAKDISDDTIQKRDIVPFNIYISTLTDTNVYTLVPSVSAYNTSIGKTGEDKISCNVYKNNILIETGELDQNALRLEYTIHNENGSTQTNIYDEPIVFGKDGDNKPDDFTSSDVAIVFKLYYKNEEIVMSTVPLIKDGKDGKDGDAWQYIFCRSPYYPFDKTQISDPNTWNEDPAKQNPDSEYLGDKEPNYNSIEMDKRWYDDHQGVNETYKYEYQSYRKWDKEKKEWGKYNSPTLYSNYAERGASYSVILSNPIAVIPVGDNDWSTDENIDTQKDSTLVYVYSNSFDVTSDENITISLPDPEDNIYVKNGIFKIDENRPNKVIFTPKVGNSVFDFGESSQYKLPITVTYKFGSDGDNSKDKFESTINWILCPIKGTEDIEVFVDKRVVNTSIADIHTLKVGYYKISTNNPKKFIESGNIDGYIIKLTDDIGIENLQKVDAVADWGNASYNFIYNGKNRNCYVVLMDKDGTSIIDYVNVISVNDGKDGASAIHLELTQDYIALPYDDAKKGLSNWYNTETYPIKSRMILYNGNSQIEYNDNISYEFIVNGVSNNSGFTVNESNGEFVINPNIINGDLNIECVATYNGISYHKMLTIDLEEAPYELDLSTYTISRNLNNGKISTKEISVAVKCWNTKDKKWEYTGEGVVKASTINGQEAIKFGAADSGEYKVRKLNISDSDLEKNTVDTEVRISYYKDENSSEELSYEIIGVINDGKDGVDGKDGKDGKDGISAIHLELTQDYIGVPCNDDGTIHVSYNEDIKSQMLLYNGYEIIEDGITYSFKINGTNTDKISANTDGTFTVPKNLIDGDTNVECIATYNTVSFHKTLTIDLENTPYELELNKKVLSRDVNTNKIIDESITVLVKCWIGGKWVYIDDGKVYACTIKDKKDPIDFGDVNENHERTLGIAGTSLEINTTDIEVRISYRKDGKELSYETIGIIDSGRNAVAPYSIGVEILGYSLNETEDPEDESKWYSTINELGTLTAGTPIYILNETTWSDGNKSRSVTVTLSGTQGIDGKSRVLFYLGSFEEGKSTLEGETVFGYLTDTRCDYYIDVNGQSWMRKGTSQSCYGYKNPSPQNIGDGRYEYFLNNWEMSNKVGFLQAGAITADMINTGSLVADSGFITELTSNEILAKNLQVDAANVKGTLTIGSGENDVKIDGELTAGNIPTITSTMIADGAITTGKIFANSITANEINAGDVWADKGFISAFTAQTITADNLTVKAANIDGKLTAGQIDASELTVDLAKVKGTLTADNIDATDLTVLKLDTQKAYWDTNTLVKSQVRIQGNEILVTEDLSPKPVLQITGASISDDFAKSSEPVQKNITFENGGFTITNRLNTQLFSNNNEPIQVDLGEITGLIPNINNDIYTKTRLYVDNFANSNDPDLDISTKHSITCKISIGECSGLMVIPKANPNSQTNTSTSVPGFDIGQQDFITTTENESVGSFSMGIRCIVYDKDGNIVATSKYKRTPSASIDFRDGKFYNDITPIGSHRTVSVPFDTMCLNRFCDKSKYTIKLALEISEILFYNIGKITMSYEFVNPSVNFYAQSLIGNMPNVNIYKDTFRYFIDDYNYLNIDDEGYFTYYGPGKIDGFGVNKEDGVWFFVGGCYFKLSDLSSSMQNASKRYKDLNERYNTVEGKVDENENTLYDVKTDLYGEGGTPTNSTPGSLVYSRNQIETDLYGAGGTNENPAVNSLMARTTAVESSFEDLQSQAVLTTSGGNNSFETLFDASSSQKGLLTSSSASKMFAAKSNVEMLSGRVDMMHNDLYGSSPEDGGLKGKFDIVSGSVTESLANANTALANANTALNRTNMNIDDILIDIFSDSTNLSNIVKFWSTGSSIMALVGIYTTSSSDIITNHYSIDSKTIYFKNGNTSKGTTFYIKGCEVTGVNTSNKYRITPINNIQYTTTTVTLPDGTTGNFQTPSTDALFGQFDTTGNNKSISADININNVTTGTNIRTTITLKFGSVK